MSYTSEMGCNLYIDTSNEHPTIITKITNVEPSEVQIKEEPYINPKGRVIKERRNKCNLWILKSPKFYCKVKEEVYLNNSIEYIISILEKNNTSFQKVFEKYKLVHLLCYGYYSEFNPYFILNKDLLEKIGKYKIPIEFDLYFFPSD